MGDEDLEGADDDFDSEALDSGHDAVADLILEGPVDHSLEGHAENRLSRLVDHPVLDALDLVDHDEVAVLDRAHPEHLVQTC